MNFSSDDMETHHIKNFKGLFFAEYGHPIGDDYEIKVIHEGDATNARFMQIAGEMTAYVTKEGEWKSSGHPDIFQYNIKSLEIGEGGIIRNGGDLKNAIGVVAVMKYHNALSPVVMAFKKEFVALVPRPSS